MRPRIILAAVGGAVLLIVIWYVALWGPQAGALSKAKKRTVAAVSLEDQLKTQLARLKSAQQGEPARRAQLEALREAIPDQPNLAQFILDTNDNATKAGIDFLSIAPAPPGAGSPGAPAAINVSISITGGYFQVIDFINRLTGPTATRLLVINSFQVSTGAAGGGLSVSITSAMYTTAAGAVKSTTTTVAGTSGGSPTSTTATTVKSTP